MFCSHRAVFWRYFVQYSEGWSAQTKSHRILGIVLCKAMLSISACQPQVVVYVNGYTLVTCRVTALSLTSGSSVGSAPNSVPSVSTAGLLQLCWFFPSKYDRSWIRGTLWGWKGGHPFIWQQNSGFQTVFLQLSTAWSFSNLCFVAPFSKGQ